MIGDGWLVIDMHDDDDDDDDTFNQPSSGFRLLRLYLYIWMKTYFLLSWQIKSGYIGISYEAS